MTLPNNLTINPTLDRWVTVAHDGAVTIRSGKVELGQGIGGAMILIAASELGLPPQRIRLGETDTGLAPAEGFTAGSLSIEHGGSAMRVACAMVRDLFMEAAEAALGGAVELSAGVFSVPGTNRVVGYGDLADKVDLAVSALGRPVPVLVGEGEGAPEYRRPDLPAKLLGAAYIQDIRLPGQAYGRVLRPEAPWLRLVSFDAEAIRGMPGVLAVVQDGAFAGIVAARDDQAIAAVEKARRSAVWEGEQTGVAWDEDQSWLEAADLPADRLREEGQALDAVQRLSATFVRPFLIHAPLGPSCAIAHWQNGRLSVHSHSQGIHPLRKQLAQVLSLSEDDIDVTHAAGAGCYGHNGADDVALDAALLSRAVDRSVMVQWSRADEMSWAPHGAAMKVALSAGLTAEGKIADWSARIHSTPHIARPGSGNGIDLLAARDLEAGFAPSAGSNFRVPDRGADRNAVPLYALPSLTIDLHQCPQGPLRSSALRSLGAHANIFAIEGFMDELAAAAGADPLAFRLAHCADPRAAAVLEAAAEAGRWNPDEPGGEGWGQGIAVARYKNFGAFYAVVVRIEIDESVRVLSVDGAVDAGRIVHRDGLINQVEGGAVQALSWTLMEEARWTVEGFAVRSWDDYPVLGFSQVPAITTRILDVDQPPLGAGECSAGPVAAAVGNAVAHALGVRVRRMPLTRDRIMTALMGEDSE